MRKILLCGLLVTVCLFGCKETVANTVKKTESVTNASESVEKTSTESSKETSTEADTETGTEASTEKAKIIEISDEKLCEYATYYYYIRHGERPPFVEIESKTENTVIIHLYENFGDHIATWDWYEVDITTLTAKNLLGNEFLLTYNEEGYTDEELCAMAAAYYEKITNKKTPSVKIDHEKDGIVAIQLYESVNNHTSTIDWYNVDRHMAIGNDIFEKYIDLR